MKIIRPVTHGLHEGLHGRHVGYEGSHVMLPMVMLSIMAVALYFAIKRVDIPDIGRSVLFDVVMVFVALGIAGMFGVVGAWLRSRTTDEPAEGVCFTGALIGAAVFYIALLT